MLDSAGIVREAMFLQVRPTSLILSYMIEFLKSPMGMWIRVVLFLFMSLYFLRSGIWPNANEPRKWYDRAIRILGGILFGSGALFGSARIMDWVK